MKHLHFIFFVLTVSLLLGCQDQLLERGPRIVEQTKTIQSKGCGGSGIGQLDTTYFVTVSDVERYVKYKTLLAKHNSQNLSTQEIRPIGPEDGVVLAYLVNFNDGWEIISADRRAPVLLASQESGNLNYDECEMNPALQDVVSWAGYLTSEVLFLRENPDYIPEDDKDKERMDASLEFWSILTNPEIYLETSLVGTKGGVFNGEPPIGDGHWELVDTYVEILDYESLDLCGTSWHQGTPFNAYAPMKTDGSYDRAPAGCVAVAGSQMLYCLYQKYGCPTTIPISASVTGYINDYMLSFGSSSSAGWVSVANGNVSNIAVLLAYVGALLPNQWGNDGTGSTLSNLKNNVFNALGYSCSMITYSSQAMLTSLHQQQLPVVAVAWDGVFYFLGLPIFWRAAGHAFLIDRYKLVQQKTTYCYEWVYDVPPGEGSYSLIEPIIEVIYGNPYVSDYIGINWGWGSAYNNVWYTATGNWNAAGYDFDQEREILYSFSLSE